jgi:hypothetical protein
MIERTNPLHSSVGKLHRERSLAGIKPFRDGPESPVGVRAFLEDAPHHLVGDFAGCRW